MLTFPFFRLPLRHPSGARLSQWQRVKLANVCVCVCVCVHVWFSCISGPVPLIWSLILFYFKDNPWLYWAKTNLILIHIVHINLNVPQHVYISFLADDAMSNPSNDSDVCFYLKIFRKKWLTFWVGFPHHILFPLPLFLLPEKHSMKLYTFETLNLIAKVNAAVNGHF